jgi:hypothetical protein
LSKLAQESVVNDVIVLCDGVDAGTTVVLSTVLRTVDPGGVTVVTLSVSLTVFVLRDVGAVLTLVLTLVVDSVVVTSVASVSAGWRRMMDEYDGGLRFGGGGAAYAEPQSHPRASVAAERTTGAVSFHSPTIVYTKMMLDSNRNRHAMPSRTHQGRKMPHRRRLGSG